MKKYIVEAVYYPNKDFTVTIHGGSEVSNINNMGVIYFNKIVTNKYFNSYNNVIKYVKEANFEEMGQSFIQVHDLYELETTSDYKAVCRKLINRGFIEYYTEVSYMTTTNYFKKDIDNDFTQFVSVITTDGVNCRTDTEFFNLALIHG